MTIRRWKIFQPVKHSRRPTRTMGQLRRGRQRWFRRHSFKVKIVGSIPIRAT